MRKFDKKTKMKIFNIILIVIWMSTIFVFSAQQGTDSGDTSRKFTIAIIKMLTGKNLELDDPFVSGIQIFIRKMAHFSIYAIGGFLIMNYTYTTNKSLKQKIICSTAFGGGYAITDEIHQFFVPGRSGNIIDVGIDTMGVVTGVAAYLVLIKWIQKLKK